MLQRFEVILFSLLLIGGIPVLSLLSARPEQLRCVPRTALYFSAVVSQWVLAILGALVVASAGTGFSSFGFRLIPLATLAGWAVLLAAIIIAGLGLSITLERYGLWPDETEVVYLLMPETRREKLWAIFTLAPTAGVCEEFLYRGFLLMEFAGWFHSMAWGWAVSSVVFGLAHVYQGWSGMVRTALLGALLALPVVSVGSLYPSMLAHALIDAVALAWMGPRFLKRHSES